MAHLSEKDIDNIFREGSKRHEFPFKESAWNNMESMLDKQDRKRKYGYFSMALVGLMVSAVVIYALLPENKIEANQNNVELAKDLSKSNASNEATKEISEFSETTTGDSFNAVPTEGNSSGKGLTETTKKTNASLENNSKSVTKNQKDNNSTAVSGRRNKTSTNTENDKDSKVQSNFSNSKGQNIDTNTSNSKKEVEAIQSNDSDLNKNKIISNSIIKSNLEEKPTTASTPNNTNVEINEAAKDEAIGINSFSITSSIPFIALKNIEAEHDEEFPLRKLSAIKAKSRFSFGLLGGIEWTTADMDRSLKRGYRLGGAVSYRINNKFLVTTGLTFSRKTYLTEGENYKPLRRWDKGIVPEIVDGTYNVFEIPLELSYFLAGSSRNSFYISTGISTFLMDKEWYGFSFNDPAHELDPNIRKRENNLSVDKKALHYFGIGTLAIGYQRRIKKGTLLQFEPYFQLPFYGIGIGQVNLVSTGLQVKVSFNR